MSSPSETDKAIGAFMKKLTTAYPALAASAPTDPANPAAIGEFIIQNVPQGDGQKWLAELMAINAPGTSRPGIGVIVLTIAGTVTGLVLIYGVFASPTFLTEMAEQRTARGLITFLFAFATIAVVIITVIATFWVKLEEVAQRGAFAKEILTLLIGIMGTILGFYFGSASPEPSVDAPAQVSGEAATGANN